MFIIYINLYVGMVCMQVYDYLFLLLLLNLLYYIFLYKTTFYK